jgi:hypothetical protein
MADSFSDVIDDGDNSVTTVTDTASSMFADAVRSEIPDEDAIGNDTVYEDPKSGKQADNVDPRNLFSQPTINELRYYYREGPYGGTVVEKPILDAFKYEYTVEPAADADDNGEQVERFLKNRYHDAYVDAKIKSRRDGLAVLHFQFADSADSAAEPLRPNGEAEFDSFTVYTLDQLSDDLSAGTVADHTDYELAQIYVSEGPEHGGVAIVDDINDPRNGEVLGYGIEPRQESETQRDVGFVHESRTQHFVHGEHVDGELGNNVTGKHVGESVLTPILQPLKAVHMGYWAQKNILYRYSAPLHAVEPPEKWGQDDFDDAREKMGDLSMMSDAVLPPGSELSVAEGVSEFDPEPFYKTLVDAICAGTEFTKSVLEGTQTGTVAGSETDVKNYFNHVERLRTTEIAADFHEAVELVARYDQSVVPRAVAFSDWTIEWGPLFKPTDIEAAEGMVSVVTAATNAIKNYVLTPDEAREVVEAGWSEFDHDVDLEALTEDQYDLFDRINIREVGRGPQDDEPDVRQNPMRQNGGGQPEGQTRSSSQPTRSTDDVTLTDEQLDQIAERVVAKIQE